MSRKFLEEWSRAVKWWALFIPPASFPAPLKISSGQPFLLFFPLVVKVLNSSQIHQQHDVLYFLNTLLLSTKGLLEKAHQNPEIQTQLLSSFGFLSPSLMIPQGLWTDIFNSTPKCCLFPTFPAPDVWVANLLKNTASVCPHLYFLPKANSCCSSHALGSSWEWETIPKVWMEP